MCLEARSTQIYTRRQRGGTAEGVPPVFEGEHDGQQSPAGVGQSLVAAGQEQDLVFRQGGAEQTQHVDYAWGRRGCGQGGKPTSCLHVGPAESEKSLKQQF